MMLGNAQGARTPSGYCVAPMSYAKLEDVAEGLLPLLPKTRHSTHQLDAGRILEHTLPQAGLNYRAEEVAQLNECAAFTIPEEGVVVLRQDVYDGIYEGNVFARSTVVHELSHVVLKHAVTLRRGPIGQHRFFEDSEWQAKALTAALMMPVAACRLAQSAHDLADMCGTSVQAATYRLERLVKVGLIPPKPQLAFFRVVP